MVAVFNHKDPTHASYYQSTFILVGMSEDIERERGCEAADRAVAGLALCEDYVEPNLL